MDQHSFIQERKKFYQTNSLPEGEHFEDAHYPQPRCLGGEETVKLWSRDHSLHGVLQSEDLGHPCIHFAAESSDRHNIATFYPDYLPLYEKWLCALRSLGGKSSIQSLGGRIPCPGVNPSYLDGGNIKKVHDRRKTDPNYDEYIIHHCRVNGAKGGAVSGPTNRNKKWCNNGEIEKKYILGEGLPEGFTPGRLPGKNGSVNRTENSVNTPLPDTENTL